MTPPIIRPLREFQVGDKVRIIRLDVAGKVISHRLNTTAFQHGVTRQIKYLPKNELAGLVEEYPHCQIMKGPHPDAGKPFDPLWIDEAFASMDKLGEEAKQ